LSSKFAYVWFDNHAPAIGSYKELIARKIDFGIRKVKKKEHKEKKELKEKKEHNHKSKGKQAKPAPGVSGDHTSVIPLLLIFFLSCSASAIRQTHPHLK